MFCLSLPSLQYAWDSTSMGLLKECPRKYYYTIILGYQPFVFAAHLAFGIAVHKVKEVYDKDRAAGLDHDEAVLNAIKFCMNYGTRDAADKFIPYDATFTKEPTKTRQTLLRSMIWYFEQFQNDPLETVILRNGQPAVEYSFKIELELETPDSTPFVLCGHLDRLVTLDGDYYFTDIKTTKGQINSRYWRQFTPSNQMSLYYFAAQAILHKPAKGGFIDAMEIGVSYTNYKRHPLHRTHGQQTEWLKDTYQWLTLAMQYATDGYWPMNDKACGNFGGCPFQPICSLDPKVRDGFLANGDYIKRQWNPLESR